MQSHGTDTKAPPDWMRLEGGGAFCHGTTNHLRLKKYVHMNLGICLVFIGAMY